LKPRRRLFPHGTLRHKRFVALCDANPRQVVESPIDVRSNAVTPIHFVGRISIERKGGFSDTKATARLSGHCCFCWLRNCAFADGRQYRRARDYDRFQFGPSTGMEEVAGSIPIRSTNRTTCEIAVLYDRTWLVVTYSHRVPKGTRRVWVHVLGNTRTICPRTVSSLTRRHAYTRLISQSKK
jgi:hypothetical protein